MFYIKIFLFLYSLHVCKCDWVSEWMDPVRESVKQNEPLKSVDDEVSPPAQQPVQQASGENPAYMAPQSPPSIVLPRNQINLKTKLEETLHRAEELLEKLQAQISLVEKKEKILKDTIANGRSGISTVTVNTLDRPPRTYFIREGIWSVCNGMLQYPASAPPNANLLSDVFSGPRCIGQEIISTTDQCVFNSIIKYETVPERRSANYKETEFFCLKPSFNKSLEQFLSVPKKIVNETCKEGTVRSLAEQHNRCGSRILSEYSYYPRTTPTSFPMEYCNEKDGSCRLLIAWHLSNTSAENYEFVRQEDNFKKYFIQSAGPYLTHVL